MGASMTHEIEWKPGWVREGTTHGLEIWFIYRGPMGAVMLVVHTSWYPDRNIIEESHHPQPLLQRHWRVRTDEHEAHFDDCDIIPASECFTSTMHSADEFLRILIAEGLEGLWKALEEVYEAEAPLELSPQD